MPPPPPQPQLFLRLWFRLSNLYVLNVRFYFLLSTGTLLGLTGDDSLPLERSGVGGRAEWLAVLVKRLDISTSPILPGPCTLHIVDNAHLGTGLRQTA